MVTPRDDPSLLEEFLRYRDLRVRQEGSSLRQVCIELSEKYNCSVTIVRCYLDPNFAKRQRKSHRQSEHRRYAREKHRKSRIKHYRRITRYPEKHLFPYVFSSPQDEADLDTIRQRISDTTGVNWRGSTIEKILRDYENQPSTPQVHEHDGLWSYSAVAPSNEEYPDRSTDRAPLRVIFHAAASIVAATLLLSLAGA